MANDTPFYRAVAEELRSGKIDDGLWLKALVESHGDEKMAHVQYTKLRVTELQEHAARARDEAEHRREREQVDMYTGGKKVRNLLIIAFILAIIAVC